MLRLGPHGIARAVLAGSGVWGDSVLADLRVGPDGNLYQLGTSPTTGIVISRYSLGPTRAKQWREWRRQS